MVYERGLKYVVVEMTTLILRQNEGVISISVTRSDPG